MISVDEKNGQEAGNGNLELWNIVRGFGVDPLTMCGDASVRFFLQQRAAGCQFANQLIWRPVDRESDSVGETR